MKKTLLVLFALAGSAYPQRFSGGIRGGVPFTDFLDVVNSGSLNLGRFTSTTNRYIIGPTAELRLPAGFGVEFDALYRHYSYNGSSFGVDTFSNSRATANAWEFPLLLKYRFPTPVVKPYVDAGVAWDTLSGLKQSITTTIVPNHTTTVSTSNPAELKNNTTTGFVLGVGLDIHVLLHFSPEVRYTRWGSQHFAALNQNLLSSQNQAEFLLGITF